MPHFAPVHASVRNARLPGSKESNAGLPGFVDSKDGSVEGIPEENLISSSSLSLSLTPSPSVSPQALKFLNALSSPDLGSFVERDKLKQVLTQKMVLRDSCISLPFTIIFFIMYVSVVQQHEDIPGTYRVESGVRTLVENLSCDDKAFKISDFMVPEDFWTWLQSNVVCKGSPWFRQQDLEGQPLPRKQWGRLLGTNRLLGGVMLEQVRTKPGPCKVDLPYFWECYPSSNADSEPFGLWRSGHSRDRNMSSLKYNHGIETSGHSRDRNMYSNIVHFEDEGFRPLWSPTEDDGRRLARGVRGGKLDSFVEPPTQPEKWGVFPFFLLEQTPLDILQKRIEYLQAGGWIDLQTEQISAKANIINAEVGQLTRVNIIFSFSRTGGFEAALKMQTTPMFVHQDGAAGPVVDILWLAMLLYIVKMAFCDFRLSLRSGGVDGLLKYALDLWSWVDIGTCFMGFILILLYIWQSTSINKLLDSLKDVDINQDVTVEYLQQIHEMHELADNIAQGAMWYRLLMGDYVLIIMLRFFKAFRAQPRLAVVTRTIYAASSDLFHFTIVFVAVFVSFTWASVILFGRIHLDFSSFSRASATCFAMICGDFAWKGDEGLSADNPITAAIWFWSFMLLIFFVMLNMVLAIVMDVYTEVRSGSVGGDPLWTQAIKAIQTVRTGKVFTQKRGDSMNFIKKLEDLDTQVSREDIQRVAPHMSDKQIDELFDQVRILTEMEDEKGVSMSDALKLIGGMSQDVKNIQATLGEKKKDNNARHGSKKWHEGKAVQVLLRAYRSRELHAKIQEAQAGRAEQDKKASEQSRSEVYSRSRSQSVDMTDTADWKSENSCRSRKDPPAWAEDLKQVLTNEIATQLKNASRSERAEDVAANVRAIIKEEISSQVAAFREEAQALASDLQAGVASELRLMLRDSELNSQGWAKDFKVGVLKDLRAAFNESVVLPSTVMPFFDDLKMACSLLRGEAPPREFRQENQNQKVEYGQKVEYVRQESNDESMGEVKEPAKSTKHRRRRTRSPQSERVPATSRHGSKERPQAPPQSADPIAPTPDVSTSKDTLPNGRQIGRPHSIQNRPGSARLPSRAVGVPQSQSYEPNVSQRDTTDGSTTTGLRPTALRPYTWNGSVEALNGVGFGGEAFQGQHTGPLSWDSLGFLGTPSTSWPSAGQAARATFPIPNTQAQMSSEEAAVFDDWDKVISDDWDAKLAAERSRAMAMEFAVGRPQAQHWGIPPQTRGWAPWMQNQRHEYQYFQNREAGFPGQADRAE